MPQTRMMISVHARQTVVTRTALSTSERSVWHCEDHTAKPESATCRRFLITKICCFRTLRSRGRLLTSHLTNTRRDTRQDGYPDQQRGGLSNHGGMICFPGGKLKCQSWFRLPRPAAAPQAAVMAGRAGKLQQAHRHAPTAPTSPLTLLLLFSYRIRGVSSHARQTVGIRMTLSTAEQLVHVWHVAL